MLSLSDWLIEREREKHLCERETLTGCLPSWTHNLGMCPDQELNRQHFASQKDIPTNWAKSPHLHETLFQLSMGVHLDAM